MRRAFSDKPCAPVFNVSVMTPAASRACFVTPLNALSPVVVGSGPLLPEFDSAPRGSPGAYLLDLHRHRITSGKEFLDPMIKAFVEVPRIIRFSHVLVLGCTGRFIVREAFGIGRFRHVALLVMQRNASKEPAFLRRDANSLRRGCGTELSHIPFMLLSDHGA